MCTKYLNANIALFKTVSKNNNKVIAFGEPFDCLIADCEGNEISITDFNVITYLNLLESSGKNAGNVLDRRGNLEVCIRLTKCTKESEERLSVDLDRFEIITEGSQDIHYDACVPYLNYKRITHIDSINLDVVNPKGSYVIKVLVKEPTDEKYTVQAITHLTIE